MDKLLKTGAVVNIPLPEEAICVAMNHATTKNPISIHNIAAVGDDWQMSYTRADGAYYSVGCSVVGKTVKFRYGARWNMRSTITYWTEFSAGKAQIVIRQTWTDGSKNDDRISFDALSKFGVSTDDAIARLRKTTIELK